MPTGDGMPEELARLTRRIERLERDRRLLAEALVMVEEAHNAGDEARLHEALETIAPLALLVTSTRTDTTRAAQREGGRKGGQRTVTARGREHFARIARLGVEARRTKRGEASSA